ncbi:MAG TPA: SCP2 sterol-binding domain-containing protein [Polyangia bacterium]|jgi:putative sterol carrier protein
MGRSVQEIIENVKRREFDPRVRHLAASYRFDIEGTGTYRVEVDHGRFTVREDGSPADCVVKCSAEDFVRIAEGEQNMLTAVMQGRVQMEGDLALAKLLHGLLPAPKHEQPQEGARA